MNEGKKKDIWKAGVMNGLRNDEEVSERVNERSAQISGGSDIFLEGHNHVADSLGTSLIFHAFFRWRGAKSIAKLEGAWPDFPRWIPH